MDSVLSPITHALGWLLSVFYEVIPNLGAGIVVLTLFIMLLLYPLTAKQVKSMIAMQRVQPEIKKLQAKYKHDRQKLNEELMRFYQENKINPLAGCLPLLLQLPIFFSLFRVLREPYKYVPKDSTLYDALCNGFAKACGSDATKSALASFKAQGVNVSGITKGEPLVHHLRFLGMDLQLSPPNQTALWASILAFGLVVLVILAGYLQTRQSQKRTPNINKQVAMVTKVFPIVFGFICLVSPAGLILYWGVSSVWRMGQQEVIFRKFGSPSQPKHPRPLKAAAEVVDAKSTARDELDAAGDGSKAAGTTGREAPAKEIRGSKKAKPAAPAAPPARTKGAPAPAYRTEGKSRGLRALFQLPPPADANGDTRRGAAGGASGASGRGAAARAAKPGGGITGRPGEAGRRSSGQRKKRRR